MFPLIKIIFTLATSKRGRRALHALFTYLNSDQGRRMLSQTPYTVTARRGSWRLSTRVAALCPDAAADISAWASSRTMSSAAATGSAPCW